MATPTNQEQELLELINRARSDPQGEAGRIILNAATQTGVTADVTNALKFFDVNGTLFQQRMSAFSKVAPLAWSTTLADAAASHSARMIAADQQSHQISGEQALSGRADAAGYLNWTNLGENIYAFGNTPTEIHAAYIVDWGGNDGGMQSPAGHRQNILSASFFEVGLDLTPETNSATSVGPLVSTEDFGASSNYKPKLVGVAFKDVDGDKFYDAGEGLGNVTISASGAAGTFTTTSWSSGGYQLSLAAGTYSVTISGGGLSKASVSSVTIGSQNVKLDVNDALGNAGTVGRDVFTSTPTNENFDGGASIDTVVYSLARSAASISKSQTKILTVSGPQHGTDTLVNIERLKFTDGTLAFDNDGNAGQVYRLYQASFARTPDTPGLKHNVDLVDGGLTLQQMSSAFLASTEFQQRYGTNVSDNTFINALYQNVLHRDADPTGLAGWMSRLSDGSWNRTTVLIGFSESPENISNVSPAITNGIWLA